MGTTRTEKRVTKVNRRGETVSDKTTVKETSTLGKVVKGTVIAGAVLLALSVLGRKK